MELDRKQREADDQVRREAEYQRRLIEVARLKKKDQDAFDAANLEDERLKCEAEEALEIENQKQKILDEKLAAEKSMKAEEHNFTLNLLKGKMLGEAAEVGAREKALKEKHILDEQKKKLRIAEEARIVQEKRIAKLEKDRLSKLESQKLERELIQQQLIEQETLETLRLEQEALELSRLEEERKILDSKRLIDAENHKKAMGALKAKMMMDMLNVGKRDEE